MLMATCPAKRIHYRRTDRLCTDWLKGRQSGKPFMLYLSHKAVHSEFVPADRHKERYKSKPLTATKTMDPANHIGSPMWLRNQRNSFHPGVDFPYHGNLNIEQYYKRYAETLLAVDESIGRVMEFLRDRKCRVNAGDLHGRQRLCIWRARADRQAHRLRRVHACADADAVSRSLQRRLQGEPACGKYRYCTNHS